MAASIRTVIYPVTDIDNATAVFAAILGSTPVMDQPYYVQFDADVQEFGWTPTSPARA